MTLGVYEDRADFQEKLLLSNENFARLQNQIYDGINIRVRSGVYFLDPDCREIDLAVDRANLARKSVDYILKSTVVLYKDAPFSIKLRENEMINRMEYALMHGGISGVLPAQNLFEGRLGGRGGGIGPLGAGGRQGDSARRVYPPVREERIYHQN